MARKKVKRKTAVRRKKYVKQSFLDKTVPVRVLVKYSAIVLVFLIIFGAAFALGRVTKKTTKQAPEPKEEKTETTKQVELEATTEKPAEEEKTEIEKIEKEEPEPTYEVVNYEPEQHFEQPDYVDAEFGFEYKNVEIDVTDLEKEERGNNWASIESLKLTVKNNEYSTIINPTRLKIKLNAIGKGSVWWDDEVFLPDSFKNIRPGESVSEVIPVHVSFSDIYSEKDLKVVVLDDFDMPIKYYDERLVIK